MKIKALPAILTCVYFLPLQGLDSENSRKNLATNSTKRILYGKLASVTNYPFLVKLDIDGSICAGAIITDQWILTAGHCVNNRVCPGEIEMLPAVWHPLQNAIKPTECYTHPQFSKSSYAYDIGLIKVQGNLLQDGRAKAISLPAPGTAYPPGTRAVIAGWGQTEHNTNSRHLLWGDFQLKEWDFCNKKHIENMCKVDQSPNCVPRNMPRRVLCVQGLGVPPAGTCFGDSGGPLVINGVVAGVDSFGIPDGDMCKIGEPSMHTSVADFLPWIYSHIAPERDTSGIPVRPED